MLTEKEKCAVRAVTAFVRQLKHDLLEPYSSPSSENGDKRLQSLRKRVQNVSKVVGDLFQISSKAVDSINKQKSENDVVVKNDGDYDPDDFIPEVHISDDLDQWTGLATSTPKPQGRTRGRKRKEVETTHSTVKRSPTPLAATLAVKTTRGKKKSPEAPDPLPEADSILEQSTTKRVRNWKKESWIEKAQKDPTRTCDLCGKSFIFPAVMLRHKKIVHQGLKPYGCASCGKTFTQKVILNKHTCDFSKETGNRDFLQMAREEELRKFVCKVCNKRFKYPTHLTLHEMNHTENRPFPCNQCEKSFRRPDHLKYHVRIVHVEEKKFVCTTCGITFKSISSLRAHEKKHTSDQGHLCNICGKSIKSMYQMSRHQKTHQDELPFECPVCQKRFKMKDYLGQHLRRGKSCSKKLPVKSCNDNSSYESILPHMVDTDENIDEGSEIHNNSSSNYNSDSNIEVKDEQDPLATTPPSYPSRAQPSVTEMSTIPMDFACFPTSTVDERLLTEL